MADPAPSEIKSIWADGEPQGPVRYEESLAIWQAVFLVGPVWDGLWMEARRRRKVQLSFSRHGWIFFMKGFARWRRGWGKNGFIFGPWNRPRGLIYGLSTWITGDEYVLKTSFFFDPPPLHGCPLYRRSC